MKTTDLINLLTMTILVWVLLQLCSCATVEPTMKTGKLIKRSRYCTGQVTDWVTMRSNCEVEMYAPVGLGEQ